VLPGSFVYAAISVSHCAKQAHGIIYISPNVHLMPIADYSYSKMAVLDTCSTVVEAALGRQTHLCVSVQKLCLVAI
jgi:hypothetical protein